MEMSVCRQEAGEWVQITTVMDEQQTINFPCVGEHGKAKPQTGNSTKSKCVPAVKRQRTAMRMWDALFLPKTRVRVWALPTTAATTISFPRRSPRPAPSLPHHWNLDPHHPPHSATICPVWSTQTSLNWLTEPTGSAHPQFIPTLF